MTEKRVLTGYSKEAQADFKNIADYINDKAKFPEQMYYVKLLDRDEGYLNYQHSFHSYFINNKDADSDYQTQFTISEIEAIDPRYIAFAVPVDTVED